MFSQRLWVWAIVALPTQTCHHLCLDEMGGRRMLLTALFPLSPCLLLYQTHQGWTPTEWAARCKQSLLIKHLAWRGNHVTVSPSLKERCSVFIRLENGKMKPELRESKWSAGKKLRLVFSVGETGKYYQLAATQHKCIIITLTLHKMVKVA